MKLCLWNLTKLWLYTLKLKKNTPVSCCAFFQILTFCKCLNSSDWAHKPQLRAFVLLDDSEKNYTTIWGRNSRELETNDQSQSHKVCHCAKLKQAGGGSVKTRSQPDEDLTTGLGLETLFRFSKMFWRRILRVSLLPLMKPFSILKALWGTFILCCSSACEQKPYCSLL